MNRITEILGCKYPIIQAPMGWIARSTLASAVSNALDEAAKQWEDILNRVGKDNVRKAYAVGVAMEDNKQ